MSINLGDTVAVNGYGEVTAIKRNFFGEIVFDVQFSPGEYAQVKLERLVKAPEPQDVEVK